MTAAALALLAAAPPAAALTNVFVAYGEGTTRCTITVSKYVDHGSIWTGGTERMKFYGATECDVPLEQTGHASVPGDAEWPAVDGGLCSGFRTSCRSGVDRVPQANDPPATYRISLRAPLGQGWVGVPTDCSGVGTDNLKCEFGIDDVWTPLPFWP